MPRPYEPKVYVMSMINHSLSNGTDDCAAISLLVRLSAANVSMSMSIRDSLLHVDVGEADTTLLCTISANCSVHF